MYSRLFLILTWSFKISCKWETLFFSLFRKEVVEFLKRFVLVAFLKEYDF